MLITNILLCKLIEAPLHCIAAVIKRMRGNLIQSEAALDVGKSLLFLRFDEVINSGFKCKKRRGRSKYLLSVDVGIASTNENGETSCIPAKIVYVRNRSNRKDWLALICTDTELSEEDIIQTYGKRWDIEVFFKTCKDMLKLETGCHSLSYDAHTAYTRYVPSVSIIVTSGRFFSTYCFTKLILSET